MVKVDKKTCKIMQWNARSAASNKNSLIQFLNTNDIDIVLLSETWFKPGFNYAFPGYNILRRDRVDGKAGVAIFAKKSLAFKEIKITQNFNNEILVCGIQVSLHQKNKINFFSIYRPPNINTCSSDWANIFNNGTGPTVIGGDFNAHNRLWGSCRNDQISTQIIDAADNCDFIFLNNGSPTRFVSPVIQKSAVDISFCSPDLATKITWYTVSDTLGSDHFPIIMDLDHILQPPEVFIPKYKWNNKKANWPLFEQLSQDRFTNIPDFTNLDDKYLFFINGINSSASGAIPQNKPYKIKNKPPPPWWDNDCSEAIRKRKTALKTYEQMSNSENYIKCKEVFAQCKKLFKKKARDSWRTWVSKLNKDTPSTELWKQAKIIQRIPLQQSKSKDYEWVEFFFDKIAPPSVNNVLAKIPETNNLPHMISKPFILSELNLAIKTSHNSAPGLDDISYPMIYNLSTEGKIFLLEIFNEIWLKGGTIESWKEICIVPILKPNKDANIADSYRPISLLSCILKTFERMIKTRLEIWFYSNQSLPNNQLGFKRGFGTIDAVANIVTDIQSSFTRNDYVGAAFLDIKGAYDCVDLKILENKLIQFDVPRNIAHIITTLFINRTLYLRQHDNTKLGPRYVSTGLPQGSVLSPLLFNVYTAGIHSIHENVIQYADDFCIYSMNRTYDGTTQALGLAVEQFKFHCSRLGFQLSVDKSIVTIFTRHHTPNDNAITLGQYVFPYKREVKYLGIILDQKLSWKPFIENIVTRCQKGINFLKMVTKTWWGAEPKTALLFYRTYIRSILDYGCQLYGAASKSLLKELDVVQNKALRLCIGAMNSTPIEPLRVESLEPPLDLRREYLASKFIIKSNVQNSIITKKIQRLNTADLVCKYWNKKESPPLCTAYRETSKLYPLLNNVHNKNNINSFELMTSSEVVIPEYSDILVENLNTLKYWLQACGNFPVQIYTDASKSFQGVGSAYVIPLLKLQGKFKLNSEASIFSAEAFAIQKALEYVLSSQHTHAIILSDSLSVLTAINNTYHLTIQINPYIANIKILLKELQTLGRYIKFIWVKAHIGLQHNEEADVLAKESISSGTDISNQLCIQDSVNMQKSNLKKKWAHVWTEHCFTNPSRYTSIHPVIPQKHWHESLDIPRKYITIINRIKFGHGSYPAHLYRLKILSTDICPSCNINEKGDLDHIFFGCNKHLSDCNQLYYDLIKTNVQAPINLLHILSLNRIPIVSLLITFIKNSGIQI